MRTIGEITVYTILLMAFTGVTAFVRSRKPLENNWPVVYYLCVAIYTLAFDSTYDINIVLIGCAIGMFLRFEFMNDAIVKIVRFFEILFWGYIIYRGLQILFY